MGEVEPRKQQGKWRNFTASSVKLRLVIIITPRKGSTSEAVKVRGLFP